MYIYTTRDSIKRVLHQILKQLSMLANEHGHIAKLIITNALEPDRLCLE